MKIRRIGTSLAFAGLLATTVAAAAPTGAAQPNAAEGTAIRTQTNTTSGERTERREGQRMTATRRGNTVEYEYRALLPRALRRTYVGQRLENGGCSYSGGGKFDSSAEPVVVVEREIRQDLDRCIMTVERARLSPAEARRLGYDSRPSNEMVTAEASQASDPTMGTQSHTNFSHRGHLKNYYEEPVQGDVSTVEAHVGWTFNGSCVTSWGTHASWHWLNDTGWTDVSRWADWPGNCSERTARVYGKFNNGVFCATNDTFTEFNTTRYTGLANGGARWAWNSNKSARK